jgi:hypothetical protein
LNGTVVSTSRAAGVARLRRHTFPERESPEAIVESFSTLKLSQVYGAIAYYLENETRVKEYLAKQLELERAVPAAERMES